MSAVSDRVGELDVVAGVMPSALHIDRLPSVGTADDAVRIEEMADTVILRRSRPATLHGEETEESTRQRPVSRRDRDGLADRKRQRILPRDRQVQAELP